MRKAMICAATLSGLLTAAFVLLFTLWGQDWAEAAAITAGTVFYHFAVRLAAGTILDNWRPGNSPWFRVSETEKRLYEKMKVQRWKGLMPTYNPEKFNLRTHTAEEILSSMRQAEAVHEVNILLSFLPLFSSFAFGAFPVFLITSLLAAGYDGLFVIMQRYNRPRMEALLSAIEKRKNRKEAGA